MRIRQTALLIAVACATAACVDLIEPPQGRFGFINVETFGDDLGYTVSPVATFYGKTNLGFEPAPADTCVVGFYSATTGVSGFSETLDAGDELVMLLSGRTDSLFPVSVGSVTSYRFPFALGIPFTPGDTLSLTIPGTAADFPGVDLKVRTAEAFDHSVIPIPGDGENIDLTWDAAPEPGSLLSASLRYRNIFSTGLLNEQVFCSFADDGAGTIPAVLLGGWRSATEGVRQTKVTRMRYAKQELDTRTGVALVSTFARPTPEDVP